MDALISKRRWTIAILAHAFNHPLKKQHSKSLSSGLALYRGLLDFGLVDDPNGSDLAQWQRFADTQEGFGVETVTTLPPPGGMSAVVPVNFPRQFLPPDLPLTLTKQEAQDAEVVDVWFDRLAQAVVSSSAQYSLLVKDFKSLDQAFAQLGVINVPVVLWKALRTAQAPAHRCARSWPVRSCRTGTCSRPSW